MKRKPTIAKFFGLLSANEKAVLCRLINSGRNGRNEIHVGLLPFVSQEEVNEVLRLFVVALPETDTFKAYQRTISSIKEKLFTTKTVESMLLHLDSKKVYRRWKHPEHGVMLPILPKKRVTAGLKWSLPKRGYVPDTDVLVSPTVTLIPRPQGMWKVSVHRDYKDRVRSYLLTHFQ